MAVGNSNWFPSKRGWQFNSTDDATTPDGYLLFSRYDGDKGMHTIELLDLTSGQVVHRIDIDADTLLDGAARDSKLADFSAWTKRGFRAIHLYPLENGDLIFKDHSAPMLRVDACGNPIWRLENDLYHHTTEIGPEGKLWATTHIEPTRVEGLSEKYYDDGIIAFSADGKVLYDRSLTEVLLKQGYSYKLFTNDKFNIDPIHLNEVQPILTDGPYWKSGDLLLSLRHMSTLALFRPSTDEIIWMKQGPWSGQHDVDVINDTTIGVFNNNMLNMGKGDYVNGNSDIMFCDFATDTVTSPYKDLFEKYQI